MNLIREQEKSINEAIAIVNKKLGPPNAASYRFHKDFIKRMRPWWWFIAPYSYISFVEELYGRTASTAEDALHVIVDDYRAAQKGEQNAPVPATN